MYSCHSISECYNLFSGVRLSIRWLYFIIIDAIQRTCITSHFYLYVLCTCFKSKMNDVKLEYFQLFPNQGVFD